MKKFPPFVALLCILIAGCATNQPSVSRPSVPTVQAPSPQEYEWAIKVIAQDQQQKANQKREEELALNRRNPEIQQSNAQADFEKKQADAIVQDRQQMAIQKQKQEPYRQEPEVQQSNAQTDLGKKQAATKAWVAQNKEQIEKELTESYRSNSQKNLESFGFNGVVLDYLVDDVAVDENTLCFSQLFLWKNSDNSGEIARINVGYDLQTDKFVGSKIIGTKHFSVAELAAIMDASSDQKSERVQSSAPPEPVPSKKPSIWAPNNATVNAAYAGGIAVAVYGIEKWIEHIAQQSN
jgi:hypothetical protein